MSSSKTLKDARFTFRADIRIESDKLATYESWFAERLRHQSKTSLCSDLVDLGYKIDQFGGVFIPEDIMKMVEQYRSSVKVKPDHAEVLRQAMKDFLEEN